MACWTARYPTPLCTLEPEITSIYGWIDSSVGHYQPEPSQQIWGTGTLVSAVPEPETYAMLLAGLGLMASIVRRRKSQGNL
jgi:hypothetical protein